MQRSPLEVTGGADAPAGNIHELIEEGVSLERILTILIDEAVRARIRTRALLDVLAEKDIVAHHEFVSRYASEEEDNFEVLLDALLMNREQFRQRHEAWMASERAKFGYSPRVQQGVFIEPHTALVQSDGGPSDVVMGARKPKKKKRDSKRRTSHRSAHT